MKTLFAVVGTVTSMAVVGSCTAGPAQSTRFSPLVLAQAQRFADAIDVERLRAHVLALHAAHQTDTPSLPSWGGGKSHTHHHSAQYVVGALTSLGLEPHVDHSEVDGLDTDNVYADIVGTTRPFETVLLTAHHDAWMQGGADDNGSGVAVLLETARVLHLAPRGRTVRVVAFDREEEGLLGANRYAADHASERVVMIVNLDCVGFATDAPHSQRAPLGLALRDVGNFVLAVADEPASAALARMAHWSSQARPTAPVVGVITPGDAHYPVDSSFLRSDHAPFWRRGVPGIFLTDTANFRNVNYHTERDTPATVNYEFLRGVASVVIGSIVGFAEEP